MRYCGTEQQRFQPALYAVTMASSSWHEPAGPGWAAWIPDPCTGPADKFPNKQAGVRFRRESHSPARRCAVRQLVKWNWNGSIGYFTDRQPQQLFKNNQWRCPSASCGIRVMPISDYIAGQMGDREKTTAL